MNVQERGDEKGSLVKKAMRAVTFHIKDNRLRVGDTLPGEGYFVSELGVSRAVMREAFGALAALQLIDVGNGRKPKVGAVDGSVIATSLNHAVDTAQITVPEVWDVRRTIELRTATLAAVSRTEAEAVGIMNLADAIARDSDNFELMTKHDIAFHEAIARASHNALFLQIVTSFSPLMQVAVPTAWQTRKAAEQKSVMLERHHDVAVAIANRDPEAAGNAMKAHFDTSIGDLLRGLAGPYGGL
ncbi:FadR/GntR family transcriptional regulator [Kordiimonas aestuarii]|uniref:FadR/GntR family transcriptional regulator n=1 Tax=Kordiimonas aestuarii TaxID=1005925 RepID=UPI0021D32604|nr:FadR/GntR family transcriptional regulator [Kordiimonas aestuarii]